LLPQATSAQVKTRVRIAVELERANMRPPRESAIGEAEPPSEPYRQPGDTHSSALGALRARRPRFPHGRLNAA
jgi:hypothetical protein